MFSVKELYELQQLEVEANQAQKALAVVEAGLKDTRDVDQARSRSQTTREVVGALQREQREMELRLGDLEARIRAMEGKLYDGTTTNTKELQGIQQDVRMLRRQKSEQEDRLLELMAKGDEGHATLDAAQEQLRLAESAAQTERKHLTREEERLTQETARLEREMRAAAAKVSPQELKMYQSVKASRGLAVSKVEGGICRACGLSLPSHELQRARMAQDQVRCGSCGRFLYVG